MLMESSVLDSAMKFGLERDSMLSLITDNLNKQFEIKIGITSKVISSVMTMDSLCHSVKWSL